MKRLISLIISLFILLLIYWKVDFAELVAVLRIVVLRNCDRLGPRKGRISPLLRWTLTPRTASVVVVP